MQKTALVPYAHLPRAHHDRHVLTSTVDVFGTAHWLISESAPQRGADALPFDATVVSVDASGNAERTELSAVRARWPHLDRLPDGGFVVAASRARRNEDAHQVQVFDTLGRETASFSVGDAIEHLLMDESGHIWVGHFDENPLGIRRWSGTGELAWTSDGAHIPGLFDCYALNVSGKAAWACPYTDFPLVEIRPDRTARPVRVWANRVTRGARAVAVHGERVVFYGGYRGQWDRLAYGEIMETSVEPTDVALLTQPDGTAPGRRRVVARGSRIFVQPEPFTSWSVFDLAG
ncbi:hypothetical protein H9Y04_33245 [Streptomyces sp. TRM66268-LWL]|uniref:Uncharacterized protein n=1 Tax=Streptomyces polyasparticus TaxID=2767826 RepID=A0ABR7SR38_9ACTN|nr:hypothetical protein [Streptomyces polyasparticus]MBC9717407.1 hypothetical protein [Streptomyces polyasparticus]